MKFTWRGTAAAADFGDPTTSATQYLCVYEKVGSSYSHKLEVRAPAGGTNCGKNESSATCWQVTQSSGTVLRWIYKDRAATPQGLTNATILPSADARARIQLKGSGELLNFSGTLAVTGDVLAQFRNTQTSECWEAVFSELGVRSASRLKLKSDAP